METDDGIVVKSLNFDTFLRSDEVGIGLKLKKNSFLEWIFPSLEGV